MGKRMGARIDPCATPQESWADEDEKLPSLTEKLVFVRYDLNQLRTVAHKIFYSVKKEFYDQLYQMPRLSLQH